MISRVIFTLCSLLSAAILSWAYFSDGNWISALGFLSLGLLMAAAEALGKKWVSPLAALGLTAGAAVGMSYGFPALGMIASVCLALAAWDLSVFMNHLHQAAPQDNIPALERSHLSWLAAVAGIGFLLSVLSGVVPIRLTFGWMLLLVLAASFGLIHLASKAVTRSSKPDGPTQDH